MDKTARERTKKILEIIASKIEGKLLAEIEYETGLRPETIKRYITEVANRMLS